MDLAELRSQVKGEVVADEDNLSRYSTDASIFAIKPQAVVKPKDADDIKRLVKYIVSRKADEPELSITARSGGTDMTGGSINDSLVLDFTEHMNRIIEIGADYAIAQPGVYYRDFEVAALARGLMMPSYPASKLICALGGMVGNNAGGEKSMSYGQVVDYVEQLKAVLADGNEYTFTSLTPAQLEAKMALQNFEGRLYRDLYRLIEKNYDSIHLAEPTTSKNSSGYYLWKVWNRKEFNLAKLLVGSQGTLGIITEIKFRLVPPRRSSGMLILFLDDIKQLGRIVANTKKYGPESFEIFDKSTLKLAITYLPEIFHKMKGNRLRLAWQLLPELAMRLTGRLPEAILLAEFTGNNKQEVRDKLKSAQGNLAATYNIRAKVTTNFEEAQKYWTIRRESYNLLRTHNADKTSASFIEDIIVHPDQLPEFLPRLYAIFNKYPEYVFTIAGHAGDANFHIFPLMDLADPKQRKIIAQLADEVYNLVIEFKGSMSAEHNDGLVRGLFLEKMFGPQIFALFKKTKQIFDPQNIFNPHKKTDATLDYFNSHIKYH